MKHSCYLFVFTLSVFFIKAQTNLNDLKNEYILNTIKKNYKRNLIFYDTYSQKEINKYLKLIKRQFKDSINDIETINQPITISNNCNEKSIKINLFIIKTKINNGKLDGKSYSEEEISPNKVTLTYRWKIINEYLYFIFTSRPLNDSLQELIYIPL